jgi:Nif-specific regulatory protein
VTIYLPPLRERREDIPLLAQHILRKLNREYGRSCRLTPGALEVLMRCLWPGNIREMENCLERVYVMVKDDALAGQDFHCETCATHLHAALLFSQSSAGSVPVGAPQPLRTGSPSRVGHAAPVTLHPDEGKERTRILDALERCGWVQAKAARLLGLTVRQLGYRIRKTESENCKSPGARHKPGGHSDADSGFHGLQRSPRSSPRPRHAGNQPAPLAAHRAIVLASTGRRTLPGLHGRRFRPEP